MNVLYVVKAGGFGDGIVSAFEQQHYPSATTTQTRPQKVVDRRCGGLSDVRLAALGTAAAKMETLRRQSSRCSRMRMAATLPQGCRWIKDSAKYFRQ
mmetsp:Transcript_4491/g.11465  ORF Transcript_4491/g.11465 Transcript_4491/m.11465 type:complete len:97 (-) Transcript_4491:97-387(-)